MANSNSTRSAVSALQTDESMPGITAAMIDDIEHARGDYPLSVYGRLADELGVPLWLMFYPGGVPKSLAHREGIARLRRSVKRCVEELSGVRKFPRRRATEATFGRRVGHG